MSISRNVVLGPYVVCKTKPVEVETDVYGCTKCKKSKPMDVQFCDKCGRKLDIFTEKSIQDEVDNFEVTEHIKERLYVARELTHFPAKEKSHIYLANVPYGAKRTTHLDPDCFAGIQEIEPKMIGDEIALFETRFRHELEYLRSVYGSVEVKWGILVWCD